MKYHYADANNQAVGPVEDVELDELFKNGVIKRDTNVVPEGSDAWRPYSSIRAMQAPPLSSPPPLSAPPSAQFAPSNATQRCPYCDEQVSVSAKKCKHCGDE